MKQIMLGCLIAALAVPGLLRAADLEDDPFKSPYRYYHYGDWIDEERFNLDYEMRVPGYSYSGDMAYAEYPYEEENGEDVFWYDDYDGYDGDNGDYGYYNDLEDNGDSGWYDADESLGTDLYFYGWAGAGPADGMNGETDVIYDYYTDDWYEYEDSFTEWYDSL